MIMTGKQITLYKFYLNILKCLKELYKLQYKDIFQLSTTKKLH